MSAPGTHNYYFGLDAVRFCAAMLVVAFHLGYWSWASGDITAVLLGGVVRYELIAPLASAGWVGVEIFFVISGFVIANSANGATPWRFLKGRALRLYPAAWICATITLAVVLFVVRPVPTDVVPAYLASLALWLRGPWIDGVYWTLAVEIVFYAIIFLLLVVGRFAYVARLAWALTLFSTAYIVLLVLSMSGAVTQMVSPGMTRAITELTPLALARHGCFFAVGIWMWLASEGRMTRGRWLALVLAGFAGVAEILVRSTELRVYPGASWWWIFTPACVWVAVTLLTFMLTQNPRLFSPKTEWGRSAMRTIGLMTYPLYLLHNIVGAAILRVLVDLGLNRWLALIASIAMLLGICFLICRTLEPALRNGMRNLIDGAERRFPTRNKAASAGSI